MPPERVEERAEQVKQWLKEEKIFDKTIENPVSYYLFQVNFPPGSQSHLNIRFPKESDDHCIIASIMSLGDSIPLIKELSKDDRMDLYIDLQNGFLESHLPHQFNMNDGVLEGIIAEAPIFYDGLTKNALFQEMIRVHTVVMLIQNKLRMRFKKGGKGTFDDVSYA